MEQWRRRIGLAVATVAVVLVVYSLVYQWAMVAFEGEERTFFQSLQTVVEILTTAGFGGDTDAWNTNAMNVLVIVMNLSGVLLVFLAVPLFGIPLFRQALKQRYPEESSLTDHVIICGYSERDEILGAELDAADIPYVYIESDPQVVEELMGTGVNVIYGDSEQVETLRQANIEQARAVVADINDEVNPTVILSAKRANPDVQVVSLVHETEVATYHRFAGADEVVEGPQVLGESLGMRAVASLAEKFRATIDVDTDLDVTELLVEEGSPLHGETIAETHVFDDMGATIIGGWFDGKFVISPEPDTRIQENTILLVAGHYEDLTEVKARRLPTHHDDPPRVVICGHGVVGRTVAETIEAEGIDYDIIDREPHNGTDIVGDVTDPRTLARADLENARAVVLALDKDTTTIFTTLIIETLAPDTEIIARVHEPDNVWKLYNAGADFALSMSVVTGEMLASSLIEHKDILTPKAEFEFVRTKAPRIAGESLGSVKLREETGSTVVAVEREGELLTDLGPGFTVRDDDVLIASGSHEDTERFVEYVH